MGGKKSLREPIYERFPLHYETYCEVFGGAAWILFGLERICRHEIYNDFNGDLVNLFRCVRDRTMAFIDELGFFPLKSRLDFESMVRFLQQDPDKPIDPTYFQEETAIAREHLALPQAEEICRILTEKATQWDVRRAAAFYKVIRYSYGSMGTSMDSRPFDITRTFDTLKQANRRLRNTVVECQSYERLIPHYDRAGTFFYLDPPYFEAERYKVKFSWEDHLKLRDLLGKAKGKWLLSYNDQPAIRELYKDFHIDAIERLDNMGLRYEKGKIYYELLISNYDMGERRRAFQDNPSLFGITPAPVKPPPETVSAPV